MWDTCRIKSTSILLVVLRSGLAVVVVDVEVGTLFLVLTLFLLRTDGVLPQPSEVHYSVGYKHLAVRNVNPKSSLNLPSYILILNN